jgi:hypothetical protein
VIFFWEREVELPERVAAARKDAGNKQYLRDIMHGLDEVMYMLHTWSKKKFGNILMELGKARKQLERLMQNNVDQCEIYWNLTS